MKHFLFKFSLLTIMLIGLPLAGVALYGLPLARYLEFPPETKYIDHARFSWIAFIGYSLFILSALIPLVKRGVRSSLKNNPTIARSYSFPWWGWLGIITGLIAWFLAWTRFSWFKALQPHTFTPLWLSFILVINALTYRRKGHCIMLVRPVYFLLLFPASSVFWWFFEYLNRFVQNWHYAGVRLGPWEYFCYATLCFSTVLPAVMSTYEWINTFSWLHKGFQKFIRLGFVSSKKTAGVVLMLSAGGLTLIGIWPDYLFALLWISPLLIILSFQVLSNKPYFLSNLSQGDWRPVISSALAALFCGWFWEMWNYFSLSKWEYSIPFVDRFQIFEMPILGYAGYLPFGLECLIVLKILERLLVSSTECNFDNCYHTSKPLCTSKSH